MLLDSLHCVFVPAAVLIGVIAVLITYSTRNLAEWKFRAMHQVIGVPTGTLPTKNRI